MNNVSTPFPESPEDELSYFFFFGGGGGRGQGGSYVYVLGFEDRCNANKTGVI